MSAVPTIKPHISAIQCPDALRALPGWLVWRFEANPGGGKPRKVPYFTNGMRRHGVQGSVEDRANMTTFEAARSYAARKGFDGVGLALMPEFNLVALDFDNCVSGGRLHPEVEAIAAQSYSEYSPSGQGVRCFFMGELGNKKDSHHPDFGLETFSSKGFVTFTGNTLDITDLVGNTNHIEKVTQEVYSLARARFGVKEEREAITTENKPLGLTPAQITEALEVLPEDLSYDEWVMVGMAMHHEFNGSTDGFEVWDEWSQSSPKYTSREYGRDRWVSFGKHQGKPVTARSLVRLANENGAHINLNGPASMEDFEMLAVDEESSDDVDFQDLDGTGDVQNSISAPKPARFEPIQAGEFSQGGHPGWIIKGVLPRAELAVVYGESGSGKSFAVLDMVAAVARGVPWRGHRVTKGKVVYICAEGAGGFRKRLIAYAARQGIDLAAIELFVIPNAPNLLLKEDALELSKAIVTAVGRADIVVVDTLAQTTPGGNENAGEDMGKALSHCKGLHRATKGMVLLVHHSGKDSSKGARGWSGVRAACDAEFEVVRMAMGRVLRTSKQKDGDDGAAWGFDLDVVDIGVDEDGDAVTSCVVKEVEVNLAKATSSKPMGPVEKVVAAVVNEIAESQTAGIEADEVIKAAAARLDAPEGGKRDTRRQRARRALETLCDGDTAPYYWDKEDNTLSIV